MRTPLPAPRRCPWCGHRCYGQVCRYCGDLERDHNTAERLPTMGDELRAAVSAEPKRKPWRATCPNPKCGELAELGRRYCASCRTALYPADTTLERLRGGGGSGRGAGPT
jgi:hypothetical protein